MASGVDAVEVDGLVGQVLVPGVIAPVLALAVAATVTFLIYRRIRGRGPRRDQAQLLFTTK